MHQYITLEDTVYLGFGANLTTGAAGDGASPLFDVRLGGAAAGAAPVLSGTPTLLTHANYSDGCYECAIAATAANGFAAGNTYLVFVTLTIDSVTPAAMIGSFRTGPAPSNLLQVNGAAQTATLDTIKADTAAILVDTGTTLDARIPAALVAGRIDATVDATGMESGAVATILTTAMTEAYAADGVAPTLAQALFLIQQSLHEFVISGTTRTVNKLDGTTAAATFSLDSATAPTSTTRAS